MPVLQEAFLEIDWGGEEEAQQARDQRVAQLQEQGFICTYENLYNVYGYRVFTLEATSVEPTQPDRSTSLRHSSSDRPVRKFDRR